MTAFTALARFPVVIDAVEVSDFAQSLGLEESAAPPPTFPIRILFHPTARDALKAFMPADGSLPIHIGQRFRYHRPLNPGESLDCALSAAPADDSRPFALVRIELATPTGDAVCEAESEIAFAAPGFTWNQPR